VLGLSTGARRDPLGPRRSQSEDALVLADDVEEDVEEDAAADEEESDDELDELVAGVAEEDDERLSVR
jgi:hypothetical protein